MSSFNSSLFEDGVLTSAAKLAIETSKNLSFDYFQQDDENNGWGIRKTQSTEEERILFKSPEEYTSPCLLYTSPSPRDKRQSRMPSSA